MLAFTSAQAQFKIGPKIGMNLSTMTLKSSGISLDPQMLVGFHAGLITEISFTENLKLQPGILFSTKGSKYELTFLGETFDYSLTPGVIEVPVNAFYIYGKGPVKLILFAGPYVAYGITGKSKINGESQDILYGSTTEDDMKPFDFGLNFGAGVNVNGFMISAQYGFGLLNLAPDNTGDTDMKNKVIGISVAYMFGGE
jgi:hypothetical protein